MVASAYHANRRSVASLLPACGRIAWADDLSPSRPSARMSVARFLPVAAGSALASAAVAAGVWMRINACVAGSHSSALPSSLARSATASSLPASWSWRIRNALTCQSPAAAIALRISPTYICRSASAPGRVTYIASPCSAKRALASLTLPGGWSVPQISWTAAGPSLTIPLANT